MEGLVHVCFHTGTTRILVIAPLLAPFKVRVRLWDPGTALPDYVQDFELGPGQVASDVKPGEYPRCRFETPELDVQRHTPAEITIPIHSDE